MPSSSRTTFHRALRTAGVAALVGGLHWTAQAQGALPAMKTQGAISYACGGIGSDESTAMRAAMKSHPLSLLFARAGGDYLANVDVSIQDGAGAKLGTLRADGPVCLVDLPAGNYSIEATSGGAVKRQSVSVGTPPKTLDFRF